jgi:hypothetical protein
MIRFQDSKIPRFQDSRIPRFQDSKIPDSMFYSLPILYTYTRLCMKMGRQEHQKIENSKLDKKNMNSREVHI